MSPKSMVSIVVLPVLFWGCSEQKITDTNRAPTAEITSHANGDRVVLGQPLEFVGEVADGDHDNSELSITWSVNDDPVCTSGADEDGRTTCSTTVDEADVVVTLEVEDPLGATDTDSVVLLADALGNSPVVEIRSPDDGDAFEVGEAISFSAVVSDVEDDPTELSVTWSSSEQGAILAGTSPDADGTVEGSVVLSEGTHAVSIEVVDSMGNIDADAVTVIVGEAADDTAAPTDDTGVSPDDTAAPTDDTGVSADDTAIPTDDTATPTDDTAAPSDDTAEPPHDPPSVTSITLSPDPVLTDDELSASVSATTWDGSMPTLVFEWRVNGVVASGEATGVLSGDTWFDKDDVVLCTVTPSHDGLTGSPMSASITVTNTPPEDPTVSISPDAPVELEDDLVCSLESMSWDADGDAVFYTTTWARDGTTFTGTTTTTMGGDTVPASATTAGESWRCRITPNDGDEDGPWGQDTVVIADAGDPPPPPLADCTDDLGGLGAPVEVAYASGGGTYGIGAWMADASPSGSDGRWVMVNYDGDQVLEYDSLSALEGGTLSRSISLDEDWAGTGHVVFNGMLYYNEEDSPTMVGLDLETGEEVVRRDLTGAGYDGAFNYSWGGVTDFDFAVDDDELYVIHSSFAAEGRFEVKRLNPLTLATTWTWTADSALKNDFANAFIACGVLYGIDIESTDGPCFWCTETSVDFAWDLGTGLTWDPGITFTSPGSSGYIAAVDYNPRDGLIYVYRGGNMGLITPSWD